MDGRCTDCTTTARVACDCGTASAPHAPAQIKSGDHLPQTAIPLPAKPKDDNESAPRSSRAAVAGAVVFYVATSIATVTLNRASLRDSALPPLAFLAAQIAVAVVLLAAVSPVHTALRLSPPRNRRIFVDVLPLAASNAVGLALNTLCIAIVDAAGYQLGRALVLPATALIAHFLGTWRGGALTVAACTVVTAGFCVGNVGFGAGVPAVGIFYAVASALCSAVHAHVAKAAVSTHHRGADVLFLSNAMTLALLLPAVFVLERHWLAALGSHDLGRFLVQGAITGALGTAIGAAGLLQISLTSALTHAVVSAARGVLQAAVAHSVLGETLPPSRAAGIVVALCGAFLYAYSLA